MSVAPASAVDLPGILALESAFDHPWSADTWSAELASDRTQVLVARDCGEVVGVVTVSRVEDTADLDRVVVAPGARRSGLGLRLVGAALDRLRAEGAHRVLLEVEDANAAALALYAAAGFVPVARRADYYGPGRDAVVMQRELREGDAA